MLPMDRIRTLLRECDDPHHLERPRDFDPKTSADRFADLTRAVGERFGPSCRSGLHQDSSAYGRISVPVEATGLGLPLRVTLSNFGHFVIAETGDWSQPDPARGLTEDVVTWLDEVCAAAGCVFVPVTLLQEPYDGPSLPAGPEIPAETWAALSDLGEDDGEDDGAGMGADVGEDEAEPPPVWAERYFTYM
ncbi:hypothetical protein [Streptomyces europaeiscabiei]|uniref:hypothetical protein n=1 Tax=Streptomyces europaeiscabiei TaxID=146819 RepID=UPI0038F79212